MLVYVLGSFFESLPGHIEETTDTGLPQLSFQPPIKEETHKPLQHMFFDFAGSKGFSDI